MNRAVMLLLLFLTVASGAALPDEPSFLWRFETDGVVREAPAGDGDFLFVATDRGTIIALDEWGARVWKTSFSRKGSTTRFLEPLVVCDGVLFARTAEAVFALDAASGKPVDQALPKNIDAALNSEPRVAQAIGDVVQLCDSESGKVLWSKKGSAEITALAIIDEMIVVCAADGSVSAWGAPRGARDSNVDES